MSRERRAIRPTGPEMGNAMCFDVVWRARWREVTGGWGREVKCVDGWCRRPVRNFLVYVPGWGGLSWEGLEGVCGCGAVSVD